MTIREILERYLPGEDGPTYDLREKIIGLCEQVAEKRVRANRKSGRQSYSYTARVREIMEQEGCSYPTAYARWRREEKGMHPEVAELAKKLGVSLGQARQMLYLNSLVSTSRDQDVVEPGSKEDLERRIAQLRRQRVQAKREKDYDAARALTEQISELEKQLEAANQK